MGISQLPTGSQENMDRSDKDELCGVCENEWCSDDEDGHRWKKLIQVFEMLREIETLDEPKKITTNEKDTKDTNEEVMISSFKGNPERRNSVTIRIRKDKRIKTEPLFR